MGWRFLLHGSIPLNAFLHIVRGTVVANYWASRKLKGKEAPHF